MQPISSDHETLLDSHHRSPIFRVRIYDTPLTVPSKGFNVSFYEFTAENTSQSNPLSDLTDLKDGTKTFANLNAKYSGLEPAPATLAFDWGSYSPPPVSQIDNYAIKWSGKFFARYSGQYTFYVDSGKFCGARITLSGSVVSMTDADGNTDPWYADAHSTQEFSGTTVSLTAGTWYDIAFHFWAGSNADGDSLAYVCFKYKEPSGATTQYNEFGQTSADLTANGKPGYPTDYAADTAKKPFSAGVVNTTANFLTGTTLTQITDLDIQRHKIESSTCQLQIPLSASTSLTVATSGGESTLNVESTQAFPNAGAVEADNTVITYDGKNANQLLNCQNVPALSIDTTVALVNTDYAFDRSARAWGSIKKFRLYRIETGHYDADTNTEYYTDRLWGHLLANPQVQRTKDGDTLQVEIWDFQNMLQTTYNQNYPDYASYSMADYYERYTTNEPDGVTRPTAYDKWILDAVIRDIYIKAGIDPIWTYMRRRMTVTASPAFATDFGDYYIQGSDIQLEHNIPYGNPTAVAGEKVDAEYRWSFGYGDIQLEQLSALAKNYGYQVGFAGNGSARFEGINIPFTRQLAKDGTQSGTWTQQTDLGAYKAEYQQASSGSIEFSFTGRMFDVVIGRQHNTGMKVKIEVDGAVATSMIVDGVIANETDGVYDLDFTHPDGSGNTWWYYDGEYVADAWNPAVIRYNGILDYGSHTVTVTINALGDASNVYLNALYGYDYDYRLPLHAFDTSEIFSLDVDFNYEDLRNEVAVVGTLQGAFQDTLGNVVNPNNPITLHIFSRATDINSMYDETVTNYIGRRIPFEIYDPSVISQERADHLAVQTMRRHRSDEPSPQFEVLADPRWEPNDALSVQDLKLNTERETETVWVADVREQFRVNREGQVDARTQYVCSSLQPVTSYEARPAPDLSLFNNEPIINIELRQQGKRISGPDATADTAKTTITIGTDPDWDTDMWAGYYFMKGDIAQAGNAEALKITGNTNNTLTVQRPVASQAEENWLITFDPFDSELKGQPIEVHFDLLTAYQMEAQIVDFANGNKVIAVLNKSTRENVLDWGEGKVYYWDGVYQDEANDQSYYLLDDETRKYIGEDVAQQYNRPPYAYVGVSFKLTNPNDESIMYVRSYDSLHGDAYQTGDNAGVLTQSAFVPGIAHTKILTPPFYVYPEAQNINSRGSLQKLGVFTSDGNRTSDGGTDILELFDTVNGFELTDIAYHVRLGMIEPLVILYSVNAGESKIAVGRLEHLPQGISYEAEHDLWDNWDFQHIYYELWDLNETAPYSADPYDWQHLDSFQGNTLTLQLKLADIYSTDWDPTVIKGYFNNLSLKSNFTITYNGTDYTVSDLKRADMVPGTNSISDMKVFWWTPNDTNTLYYSFLNVDDILSGHYYWDALSYLAPQNGKYPIYFSGGWIYDQQYAPRTLLPSQAITAMSGVYDITIHLVNAYTFGDWGHGITQQTINSDKDEEGLSISEWTNLKDLKIRMNMQDFFWKKEDGTNVPLQFWMYNGEPLNSLPVGWLLYFDIDIRDRAGRKMAHCSPTANDYLFLQWEPDSASGTSQKPPPKDSVQLPFDSPITFNTFEA